MRKKRILLRSLAVLGTVGIFGWPADAAIHRVPGDYPTIQAGISASSPFDTVLVDPGVYPENVDFLSYDITVASRYLLTGDPADIAATVIQANVGGPPVVRIGPGQTRLARLCGFTITGGVGAEGSGVYCAGSSPTIDHNTITNNCPQYDGGGIHVADGGPLIEHNDITGN